MSWITVDEKLPEVGESILVFDGLGVTWAWYFDLQRAKSKYLNKAGFYCDAGTEFGNDYNYGEVENVTHWMTIPEPPK